MSGALEQAGAHGVSATAWTPPAELSFEDWAALGRKFATISNASRWWLGSWLLYGEDEFGDRYGDAAAATGYSTGDLMDMAWIASTFEPARRRADLSWSHHREVAGLPPGLADQLLERAAAEGWSQKRLRTEVRDRRGPEDSPDTDLTTAHTRADHRRAELVIETERSERWLVGAVADVRRYAESLGLRIVDTGRPEVHA